MAQTLDILIIGGSGFLSGTLARQAIGAGHRVWAVTRGQRPLPAGVTPIVADRKESGALSAALGAATWDLVVDCIGFDAADAEQDVELFRERAAQLVFISTDFVYDPQRRSFPQAETPAHYLTEGYGGKKRQCEIIFENSDSGDMRWTVLRPGHIYGPGSQLGCLPTHGRDRELIERMRRGEPLRLVGGGHFLQQPIFAPDLAETILSCAGNRSVHGAILNSAGPDVIQSRRYYEIIADVLETPCRIEEIPVSEYAAAHPEHASFLCHRFYDLTRLHNSGLAVPATSIEDGLRQHVQSLVS